MIGKLPRYLSSLTRNALMPAQIIDGIAIAKAMRDECRVRVQKLDWEHGIVPGLAVIHVGSNPASRIYVRNKMRACADVGVRSLLCEYPDNIGPDTVLEKIAELNADPATHGILVQLPLPLQFDLQQILNRINRQKDVDGFHRYNAGALMAGNMILPPCTPYGIIKMLEYQKIPIDGVNAVVVGASIIVGRPMALMLIKYGATVAICHAKTRDLAQFTSLADILVVAAGYPNLIRPWMVRPGATVIDVGMNRLTDGRLVGDIDFEGVRKKAAYVTPVPGGVGPMTVTMLLINTITIAERSVHVCNGNDASFPAL